LFPAHALIERSRSVEVIKRTGDLLLSLAGGLGWAALFVSAVGHSWSSSAHAGPVFSTSQPAGSGAVTREVRRCIKFANHASGRRFASCNALRGASRFSASSRKTSTQRRDPRASRPSAVPAAAQPLMNFAPVPQTCSGGPIEVLWGSRGLGRMSRAASLERYGDQTWIRWPGGPALASAASGRWVPVRNNLFLTRPGSQAFGDVSYARTPDFLGSDLHDHQIASRAPWS